MVLEQVLTKHASRNRTKTDARANLLVPVGELHHHIHGGDEKHEVEEAIAVCHMLFLVIVDLHPMAIIVITAVIIKSLVLFLGCGSIRKAGITAQSRVPLSAMGETYTHTLTRMSSGVTTY